MWRYLLKRRLLGLTSAFLAACVSAAGAKPQTDSLAVKLKDYGPAPELTNTVWLNTDQPLRRADLKGQVALLD